MDRAGSMSSTPLELRNLIADLISEARLIEVRKKGIEPASVFTELFPHLLNLVSKSEKVLHSLEEWSATSDTDQSREQLEDFGNLCFLVSAELRGCRDHVESMSSESGAFSVFAIIEQVESKLLRGLCAVETQLASILGLSSRARHVDLCRSPLQIRRLIGKFRRRVSAAGEQGAEQALRSVGASLAWLRGQDDFSYIRGSDRLMAGELQKRIVDWLRSPTRSTVEARHIADEVSAFVTLADLINRRQELVEHDRKLVSQLIGELSDSAPHGPVPGGLAQRFQKLLGRDDRLDELLASGSDTANVLRRLIGLQEELRGGLGMTPAAPPPDVVGDHTASPEAAWPRSA